MAIDTTSPTFLLAMVFVSGVALGVLLGVFIEARSQARRMRKAAIKPQPRFSLGRAIWHSVYHGGLHMPRLRRSR